MITVHDPIRKTLYRREGGSCSLKCGLYLVGEIEEHCIRDEGVIGGEQEGLV